MPASGDQVNDGPEHMSSIFFGQWFKSYLVCSESSTIVLQSCDCKIFAVYTVLTIVC